MIVTIVCTVPLDHIYFRERQVKIYTGTYSVQYVDVRQYPADTHTASLLLYVSTWAILNKKTQG
jgi:hypothetical protein